MVQNTADRTALVLRHFPSLSLRLPASGVTGRYVGLRVLEVTSGCLGVCVCLCSNNNSGATWHPEVISVCPRVPCCQNRELEALRSTGALVIQSNPECVSTCTASKVRPGSGGSNCWPPGTQPACSWKAKYVGILLFVQSRLHVFCF